MPNPAKELEVKKLVELLSSHNVQFITDHTGLNVSEITALRAKLRESGGRIRIAKNRLISLARVEAGQIPIDEVLVGPSSIVMTIDDPVSPAKALQQFIKENEKPHVKAVIIDDVLLDISKFQELASLPGVDELRAQVVRGIASPITGLVYSLSGLLRGFVVALNAIADKKRAA